jgi:hypothetical protein
MNILDLPEEVIHHIMQLSYPRDALRMKYTCLHMSIFNPKYNGDMYEIGNVFELHPTLSDKAIYKLSRYGHFELVEEFFGTDKCFIGACAGGYIDEILKMINGGTGLRSGMYKACKYGRLDVVRLLVSADDNCIDAGLCGACIGGHKDLAELLINRGANNLSMAILCACHGGHKDLALWLIGLGGEINRHTVMHACYSGNKELVMKLMDLTGSGQWIVNFGLLGACKGGHKDLAKLMIQMGAGMFNHGLAKACKGGSKELALLMIKMGANDYNWGLRDACKGGHKDLVELMLGMGATDINLGLLNACRGGSRDIVIMMIEIGALISESCIYGAMIYGHGDIVEHLIMRRRSPSVYQLLDFAPSKVSVSHVLRKHKAIRETEARSFAIKVICCTLVFTMGWMMIK